MKKNVARNDWGGMFSLDNGRERRFLTRSEIHKSILSYLLSHRCRRMCTLSDESSGAIVEDEGVLVENKTHFEIQSAGNVLIEQAHDDAIATKTPETGCRSQRVTLLTTFLSVF
jgi:hypothetical protein